MKKIEAYKAIPQYEAHHHVPPVLLYSFSSLKNNNIHNLSSHPQEGDLSLGKPFDIHETIISRTKISALSNPLDTVAMILKNK